MKAWKRPVEVETFRITAAEIKGLAEWCNGVVRSTRDGDQIEINTLEGIMVANIGDWIIKGVKNEFYPIKDDIFRLTYDTDEEKAKPKETAFFEVIDVIDQPDGSAIMHFDMNATSMRIFAKVGVMKALRSYVDQAIEEHGVD
jgi:hypothetical protein